MPAYNNGVSQLSSQNFTPIIKPLTESDYPSILAVTVNLTVQMIVDSP